MKEELIKYLTDEGYTMRRGGSYFFDRESYWAANWLRGHKTTNQRVQFLNYDDHNWILISVLFLGDGDEYSTLFEGTCDNMEQFKMVYETMLKLNEK